MFGIPAALIALAAAIANITTAAADPDPYALFAKARIYWLQQRYPAVIDYRVTVDVSEGDSEHVEHYRSEFDAANGQINVDPVSDYEQQHPASGRGINLSILFPVGRPQTPVDYMGVPQISPTYTFGIAPFAPSVASSKMTDAELIAEIRKEFHDPNPRTAPSASPAANSADVQHEIARVVAVAHDYTMTYDGTETIDGHDCYKVKLVPTRDPHRFRLRELWIDQQSGATWQAQIVINFVRGPGTAVPWMIHFQDVDGAHYISSEDALDEMDYESLVYTHTTVSFDTIHAVPSPDIRAPIFVHDNSSDPLILLEP